MRSQMPVDWTVYFCGSGLELCLFAAWIGIVVGRRELFGVRNEVGARSLLCGLQLRLYLPERLWRLRRMTLLCLDVATAWRLMYWCEGREWQRDG
jgi:hypothetical protein